MRTIFGLALAIIALALPGKGWGSGDPADRCADPAIGGDDTFSFTGTVTYVNLEGGFYGIVADGGEKYDPLNLPDDLRMDGLRVEVVARPCRETVGTHMWGALIGILEISLPAEEKPAPP